MQLEGSEERALPTRARFLMGSKETTNELGQIEHVDEEQIEFFIDQYNQPIRRVEDKHRRMYAKQYAAFKANREQVGEGTPLVEWPGIKPAQVENANMLRIGTVEDLANATDSQVSSFMGGLALKHKAAVWLKTRGDAGASAKLVERVETSEQERDALRVELAEMREAQAQSNKLVQELSAKLSEEKVSDGGQEKTTPAKRKHSKGSGKAT